MVNRLLSAPALQFKGSGWYVTDYAKSGTLPAGKKSEDKSESKAESKSDTKSSDSSSTPSTPAPAASSSDK